MADEIFRLATILLVLGLILQGIIVSRDTEIKIQRLSLFIILNSSVMAFLFAAITIKTGHLGLVSIKHISFDIFSTTLLTSCLIYNFSIVDRLISAPLTVKATVHRHVTFILVFLVLNIIYMALYSETTNRQDIIEMIEKLK